MHSVNTQDFIRRVAERIDGTSGGDACLSVYRKYEALLDREKSRLAIQTAFNRFVIRTLPPVLGDVFVSHHELDPSETSDTIVRIACIAERSGIPPSPDAWKPREDLRRALQFLFRSYVRSVTRDDVPEEDDVSVPPDAAVSRKTGSETSFAKRKPNEDGQWGVLLRNPENVLELAKALNKVSPCDRQKMLDQLRGAVCELAGNHNAADLNLSTFVVSLFPKPDPTTTN
jgi:hypothetical protein